MSDWAPVILTAVGVAVTFALGFLTWISTRKTSDRDRITKLEARSDKQDDRNLKWQNYSGLLRTHINDEKGPPAPPFPDDLFD